MADYNIYPALDVQTANPLASYLTGVQGAEDITLAPSVLQAKQNAYNQQNVAYGNSMLTQAADEALAAPADQQSAVWDSEMSKLASQGVSSAKQYIGRFDPNIAKNVQSVFSGKGQYQPPPPSPQLLTQISQMQPEARTQALTQQNEIIQGFQGINNADDFIAEVQKAEQLGIPLDKIFAGVNLLDKNSWQKNYQLVNQRIQTTAIPFRDALQQAVTNDTMGLPQPMNLQKMTAGESLIDYNNPKAGILATAPGQPEWELAKPTDTGQPPMLINKRSGATMPFTPQNAAAVGYNGPGPQAATPQAAQTQFAQSLNQSESSNNPNAQATTSTAGGINGMTDSTYVANVKKLIPGLANATPAQILQMKKSGALNGLNTDLTIQQNSADAAALTKAGYTPTNASVAVMYKLGAADGMKLLQTKDPNTPMSQIVSKDALKANPQFANMTAGQYVQGIYKQFGNDPYGQAQGQGGQPGQSAGSTKYGNFDQPKVLEYTDKDGNPQHVLAQQDKITGQWVTADQNRTNISFPNNDAVVVPATMGGGRNAQMVTRVLTDSEDAATDLANLAKLPSTTNMGVFGMRGAHGDGSLTGSALNTLVNGTMTSHQSKLMQKIFVGMGKSLAGLETGGAASAGGVALMRQFDGLAPQAGDKPIDALASLGQAKQMALNAIRANMTSPLLSGAQRKEFQKTYDAIDKAIPFTMSDVIDYENAGRTNPQLTFKEFAARRGIGGGAGGGNVPPHVPDQVASGVKAGKITLPNGNVLQGKALQDAVDHKYGAGTYQRMGGR